MRMRPALSTFALAVALSSAAGGQPAPGSLDDTVRTRVFEILEFDCGADPRDEDRFRKVVEDLEHGVVPLLLEVLESGAPEAVRHEVRQEAAARYTERQAWLAERGRELFGDDAERLGEVSEQEYVADILHTTDVRFRENAVRALGILAGPEALDSLAAAAERQPELGGLVNIAITSIENRTD